MENRHPLPDGYWSSTRQYVEEAQCPLPLVPQYYPIPIATEHDPAFVAVLPEGRVWGTHGSVIAPDNRLLWDVSREWTDNPHAHSIFQAPALPEPVRFHGTIAVLDKIGSSNYFHWMYDVLPRLHLLRLAGFSADSYIVGPHVAPFQYETLAMLGIRPNQLVMSDEQFHIIADRLLVPSLPKEERWVGDFLRTELVKDVDEPQNSPPLLYISREHCVGRTVLNEERLLRLLKPYGFQRIFPEQRTVRDQIRLFAGAQVVVGPQGAGMTNITFCPPGSWVVEFMSPTFFIATTELLCQKLQLRYLRIMGQSRRNRKFPTDPYWNGLDDIRVDVAEVAKAIRVVGLARGQ